MKLKTLRFTDMLSHVDSRVDVARYLTVFTGVSDSGKSGAMRGLNQVFRNQPAGIDLLRHGAKRGACSEVEGVVEHDGKTHTIIRRRGKSKNEYELDGQSLLAIGRDVPPEVADITRLSTHAFQLQSDGNFLLSETDGEVAKALSSTVGLAQIDKAFAEVRVRKTENDTALRVSQGDLDREMAAADRYIGLEDAESWVAQVERCESELAHLDEGIACIGSLMYALAAVPPAAACDGARKALERAVALANEAAALEEDRDRAIVLTAALECVPGSVDLQTAIDAHKAALLASILAEDAQMELVDSQGILVRLTALPNDIGMMPRRAALLLTQATQKRCDQTMAESDVNDMVTLLARMSGLPAVCQTIGANGFLTHWDELDKEAAELEREHDDVYGLFCALGKNSLDGEGCVAKITQIRDMIEQYKSEHPACPECGAEQKHWHMV